MLAKEAEHHQHQGGVRRSRESRKRDGAQVACSCLRALYMAAAEVMTHGQDDLQATGNGGISLIHVVIEEMS